MEQSWDASELTLKDLQVLLVEDEPDIAELFILILQEAGAEVIAATYACEALDILKDHNPDLLICNIKLPDQDGDWLIRQVRSLEDQSQRHLPAIAVTSYTRDFCIDQILHAGFEQILHAGFERFFSKFPEPDEFVKEIYQLIQSS
jgi:CheY-like chemotaxis protein